MSRDTHQNPIRVSIQPCADYSRSEEALAQLLEPLDGWCQAGDRVLVKVNLLRGAEPREAVTTHPELVRAIIRVLKGHGAIPTIGDSPGFESVERAARKAGIEAVAAQEEVALIELDKSVRYAHAETGRSLELSQRIEEFDRIVNACKLKTHMVTGLTGAVKNLFGCVPGKKKGRLHVQKPRERDFANMLLDIYTHLRPSLQIMDAVVGMEGQGPSSGRPRHMGYLLASTDALALDVIAAEVAQLRVKMIEEARTRKLPSAVREHIQVCGTVPRVPLRSAQPFLASRLGALAALLKSIVSTKPRIKATRCNGCGRCIKACPKECIRWGGRIPRIDHSRCIRCYCCQEICPQQAIRRRFL